MPYKNPEDKKAWKRRNRSKQRAYKRKWDLLHKKPSKAFIDETWLPGKRHAVKSAKLSAQIIDPEIFQKQAKIRQKERDRAKKQSLRYRLWRKAYDASEAERTRKRLLGRRPDIQRKAWKNTKHRLATDPHFRIKVALRKRLYNAVSAKHKSKSAISLLGIDIPGFRKHIESQWHPFMSWANYGRAWHIDHIIPCCMFDLSKEEEQRKCFHYTNLRPLWKRANMQRPRKAHVQGSFLPELLSV